LLIEYRASGEYKLLLLLLETLMPLSQSAIDLFLPKRSTSGVMFLVLQ
jgi:hypothetical protein